MRRTPSRATALAALVTTAAVVASLLTGGSASAAPASDTRSDRAEDALALALAVFDEDTPSAETAAAAPSATVALRDLWRYRDALSGEDRARADSLLARPSDRANDQFGDGYEPGTTRVRVCATDVCVHRVTTSDDAATAAFAQRTLQVMQDVHGHHVDELGWRAPLADGERGGDPRFDVYLADIGAQGLYGYCAPDDGNSPSPRTKTTDGYCVLDNDYANAVFARNSPDDNLRVTAAHEYLHAIQYAYDAFEDTWLFEATATWMEEQYADDVDDNRQYLRGGQLRVPGRSIDSFAVGSRGIYGNWIFFEHLANRFGRDVVRDVWERAATSPSPDRGSQAAVATALAARGTDLRAAYALFAADNTVPGRSALYPEGGEWGLKAPMARSATLDRSKRATGWWDLRLNHLASGTVAIRSRGYADGNRLRVEIDPPAASSSPAAYVIIHRKDSTIGRRYLAVDAKRKLFLDFASGRVDRVTVTLVNGSQGRNGQPFRIRATAVR